MRNFPDFLTAYTEYAEDGFCPPQFHTWVGLSLISGVLERKVWVRQGLVDHYPNIYTLLVSHPSVGKSTAIDRGTDLIEGFRAEHNSQFKIISGQTTEASLIQEMELLSSLQIGSHIVQYSSGYFYASEASSSALKNEHGDFNSTLTALYDCPKIFRKKLKGESSTTVIPNISFNVLAGSTFDFLKRLVNEESVLGGLASRFIYVISKERKVTEAKWYASEHGGKQMQNALISDLSEINKMVGPMSASPEFVARWTEWKPDFDRYLIALDSDRLESIMARKATNLIKTCILVAVSEGAITLTEKHWERGLSLINEVTKDNAAILSSAIIAKTDTQAGLNQLILSTIADNGEFMPMSGLRSVVLKHGNIIDNFDQTIEFMKTAGKIELSSIGGIAMIKLLDDPNGCL